jgi:hypothetical protein
MLDCNGTSEHLAIRGKILVNPEESGGRDRAQKEYGTVVLTEKIRRW